MMKVSNHKQCKNLDVEWVELILAAKSLGMTKEEVKNFFDQKSGAVNRFNK
ncbi:anti-repressor SinI family protein [Thalassobacillus pellis]|uniref:anti-repressor SinI family protein n=1 Tax=Thalassobacillus pellis TaxID=748008 RepID=UPI001EF81A5B|nr:anti-repressor SinI family protein [Thalassobacillus pellis]